MRLYAIVKNTMGYCAGNGISLYAWPGTVLTHNRISDNEIQTCGLDCLALEAGSGAVMTDNQVTGNEASFSGDCGITLGAEPWDAFDASVSNNLVRANTVYRNLSGIEVSGDNNAIFNNTALHNGFYDLADEGTDNRWRNNTYETKNW